MSPQAPKHQKDDLVSHNLKITPVIERGNGVWLVPDEIYLSQGLHLVRAGSSQISRITQTGIVRKPGMGYPHAAGIPRLGRFLRPCFFS